MRLKTILNTMKGQIDELYAKMAGVQYESLDLIGALGNRVYVTGGAVVPTTPTAGGSHIIIAAAPIVARTSGVFHVECSFPYTGATAADTVDFRVTSQTQAAAIPLTSATAAGLPASNGPVVSSAAGGIAVTGGPFGSVTQYDSGAMVQASSSTTGELEFKGICGNIAGSTPFTPFTIGNHVVFLFDVTLGAHQVVFNAAGISMNVYELPKRLDGTL